MSDPCRASLLIQFGDLPNRGQQPGLSNPCLASHRGRSIVDPPDNRHRWRPFRRPPDVEHHPPNPLRRCLHVDNDAEIIHRVVVLTHVSPDRKTAHPLLLQPAGRFCSSRRVGIVKNSRFRLAASARHRCRRRQRKVSLGWGRSRRHRLVPGPDRRSQRLSLGLFELSKKRHLRGHGQMPRHALQLAALGRRCDLARRTGQGRPRSNSRKSAAGRTSARRPTKSQRGNAGAPAAEARAASTRDTTPLDRRFAPIGAIFRDRRRDMG